jgi:hypothetical protein
VPMCGVFCGVWELVGLELNNTKISVREPYG